MVLNYIILAHKNPEQLLRLIKRLNTTNVFFYLHIDKLSKSSLFFNLFKKFSNVYFVSDENRVNCIWGDISIVKATINTIKDVLINTNSSNGYCILLSGEDYPLMNTKSIASFFFKNKTINFISSESIPRDEWVNGGKDRLEFYNFHPNKDLKQHIAIPYIFSKYFYRKRTIKQLFRLIRSTNKNKLLLIFRKREFLNQISHFGGSQWWALPMSTIQLIDAFLNENPKFLQQHKYTQAPDEIFFHSIVSSLISKDLIQNSITYVKWPKCNLYSPVTFTINDVNQLKNSKALFARKFNTHIDSEILDEIDKTLLNYT